MKKNSKILVCGGTGLVGSAIVRKLLDKGYNNILATYYSKKPNIDKIKWVQIDLKDKIQTDKFFEKEKPEYLFLAAAKVGGIMANNICRADFIYENLEIQNSVIFNAYKHAVKKLMFLGSTCIYPKNAPQPMKEEYLLTSELEYTNEPYAIAKIAGIKMCESYNLQYGTNFISVMPTNLYGPNDNFDLETSHVLPALLRKMHEAKINNTPKVEIWGSGKPRREFLYSEDMADACVFIMEKVDFQDVVKQILKVPVKTGVTNNDNEYVAPTLVGKALQEVRNTHINIGTGIDISIKELAQTIKGIVGYEGELYFNTSKPDGTMVKLTDPSKLHALGWKHKVDLGEGIKRVYEWYLSHGEKK